ncbi:monomeric sarcosine oxidase-like [Diadema antillarum]|uniref:monomeric sarcosine oxidase-like n=1 Tax=Diadema antillarum TaxID=105358 RepID=UPI003A882455
MAFQYDVCIVGAGMTGSAAARWLSTEKGVRVCLLGPLEPTEEELQDPRRTIFGSHYDEARIVSEVCARRRDSTWPVVVRRSIDRFKDLERETGVNFYHEVGCVFKAFADDVTRVHTLLPSHSNTRKLTLEELSELFPYLQSDDSRFHAILEPQKAGYISPRKYILANEIIAKRNGCDVIRDIASEVTRHHDPSLGAYMRVVTQNGGRTITAKRVLLCPGGFVNFERLLPDPLIEVDLTPMTEMAVLIELQEKDARRMAKMPSMLVYLPDSNDHRNSYILPPVKYPDGKYYLKVGHDSDWNRPLYSSREVAEWYRSRTEDNFQAFQSIYLRIYESVTGFRPKSLRSMFCVTTYTPTGQFYCDMVSPTLGLIAAGNGAGAMAADEIGRTGARMILKGAWDSDLPAEEFKIRWKIKKGGKVNSQL